MFTPQNYAIETLTAHKFRHGEMKYFPKRKKKASLIRVSLVVGFTDCIFQEGMKKRTPHPLRVLRGKIYLPVMKNPFIIYLSVSHQYTSYISKMTPKIKFQTHDLRKLLSFWVIKLEYPWETENILYRWMHFSSPLDSSAR